MDNDENSLPLHSAQLLAVSAALAELRDCWVKVSMLLQDTMTDMDSLQRDTVMQQVEQYLQRIKEVQR